MGRLWPGCVELGSGVSAGCVGGRGGGGGGGGADVDVFAGGGADVDVAGGGTIGVDVANGGGAVAEVAGDGMTPVCVGACDGIGVRGSGVRCGDLSVLIGLRKTGVIAVAVAIGVPVPGSGQGCSATGNNKQLEASEQIFKLNLVDCAPLQTSTRLPFTTSAVRHVTGDSDSTSKSATSGKIKTACAKSFTQN